MQASGHTIVLSDDDSDVIIEQASGRRRKGYSTVKYDSNRQSSAARQLSTTPTGGRRSRRMQTGNGPTQTKRASRGQGSPSKQIIDLTTLPDDEMVLLHSAGPPSKRSRQLPPSSDRSKTNLHKGDSSPPSRAAKCGVCFEQMEEKMACGPCGHVFCEPCLRAAVRTQKKCPTCRRSLQPKQIHKVYINR